MWLLDREVASASVESGMRLSEVKLAKREALVLAGFRASTATHFCLPVMHL